MQLNETIKTGIFRGINYEIREVNNIAGQKYIDYYLTYKGVIYADGIYTTSSISATKLAIREVTHMMRSYVNYRLDSEIDNQPENEI